MTASATLFTQAKKHIPGGVNSPVRAFNGVGGNPIFIDHAQGAYLFDADGKAYIDYVGSWGPMILGHAHPAVINSVKQAADKGLSFGASTERETLLAQKIKAAMPSIEKIRMVNSGTEATMSAIRLARGYTKKQKIIKFIGCYHGHSDSLLVKAGSGALTLGIPGSAGVPASITEHTLSAEYNSLEQVKTIFAKFSDDVAAVILEPITGNMNCISPTPGFIKGLQQLCQQHNSVLIFDEVMTGFRVAHGGAQSLFGIKPDLTTLGKIIGGGMPVGAFGGKAEIMDCIAPLGDVYQAGTLSGNPIAMAAGLATLEGIEQTPALYESLEKNTAKLLAGIQAAADKHSVPLTTHHRGSMFGIFFTEQKNISSYDQVTQCNIDYFKKFFHAMLEQGIYLAPSAYEAGFLSIKHGDEEIEKTIQAADKAFEKIEK